MKKKLLIILLIIFIINFLYHIFEFRENYLTQYDPKYWEKRYNESQWVVPDSKNPIGDDGLYSYSGWEYIHGSDPSLLNAEVPPLGKYMIGVSELILRNQNMFGLLSGIFVLTAFFILNKIIFKDNLLAFVPVLALSLDPLFYSQLKAPYLDNLYLGFLMMIFIFVYKEKFLLVNIFLGLMMATKASLPTFGLVLIVLTAYLYYMHDHDKIKKFLFTVPVSLLVFLLTYTQYFLHDHNLREFLGLQKYVLNFYAIGADAVPAAVFQILFTGNWPTWWGSVERVAEWSLLWPLSLLATIFYMYKVFPRRRQFKSVLLSFWIIAYIVFLMFVPMFPRYLLLVLPFMYNLTVWVLSKNMPSLLRRFR